MLQGASKSAKADGLSQCNYMQNSAPLQNVIGTRHKFLELSEEHIILEGIYGVLVVSSIDIKVINTSKSFGGLIFNVIRV